MNKPKILQPRRWPDAAEHALNEAFDVTVDPQDRPLNAEQMIAAMQSHDAVAVTVTDKLDAEIIAAGAGGTCQMIANFGVGVNHIDLAAATAAGIPVGHTPGVLVDSTADLAVGLMIAATRRIAEADRWIRTGQWSQGWQSDLLLGTDLSQATVGIVGLGPIGEATVKRLRGFGATILGWNRTPKSLEGVEMVDLEDLFRRCDIVSLHTALTPDTLQIASRKRLASMRSGATLINTGRGALVDEEALIEALSSGRLRAGLDVFESEPLPADHPLFSLDNAVLLPHVGSATFSTRMAMVTRALENLRAGMSGQPLPFCANPEVCGFNG